MYPQDEVAKTHKNWEGMPLTLRHPHSPTGQPVSARGSGVLDRFGVGVLRNVGLREKDGALRGEAWFDEERLKGADPAVHGHVMAGRPVEVSTGLFTDNVPAPAGARCPRTGRSYAAVARNYRPDHLAVLPDQKGACSTADGCGLNLNANANQAVVDVLVANAVRRVAGPSKSKACQMLKDGTANGKPLTVKQKHLFGMICGGVRKSSSLARNYARGSPLDVVDALVRANPLG